MPKDTYRNDAKIRSIEKQRDFIQRNLIDRHGKDPTNLRVAFFPGREALEYEFAYGPLGIPSENVLAIERNPEIHSYWRGDERFQVTDSPVDSRSFFKEYSGLPFDVISLDYDGKFSFKVIETIQDISSRRLLGHISVFNTNFYSMRENRESKQLFSISSSTRDLARVLSPILDYKGIMGEKGGLDLEKLNQLPDVKGVNVSGMGSSQDPYRIKIDADEIQADLENRIGMRDLRSNGILMMVIYNLMRGNGNEGMPGPFSSEEMVREREAYVDRVFEVEAEKGIHEDLNILRIQLGYEYVVLHQLPRLENFLSSHGYEKDMTGIFWAIEREGYYPEEIGSYSYVSDDGSLMFNDLILLDQKNEVLDKYRSLHEKLYSNDFPLGPLHCRINSLTMGRREIKTRIKDSLRKARKPIREIRKDKREVCYIVSESDLPERKNLGSSYKPIIRTKNKLRELVAQGLSQEEIEDRFRISSGVARSLPAFVAHRTMGTYEQEVEPEADPIPEPLEEIVEAQTEIKLIPHGKRKKLKRMGRFTEGMEKRLEYFGDDIFHLSENRTRELYDSILNSRWYRPMFKEEFSDTKVYSFFDDLMLYVKKKRKIPSSEEVGDIWKNGVKLRSRSKRKIKVKKSPEEHNEEIYDLISRGIPDEVIMKEFDLTKRKLGARKAWITMRQRS